MPRYIIYFIQYKASSIEYIVVLDMKKSLRLILKNHINRRPIKRFTQKLVKGLETYTFLSSIKYFTVDLQNKLWLDTEINISEIMSLIKDWERMISTGEIEKITKLQIIP